MANNETRADRPFESQLPFRRPSKHLAQMCLDIVTSPIQKKTAKRHLEGEALGDAGSSEARVGLSRRGRSPQEAADLR